MPISTLKPFQQMKIALIILFSVIIIDIYIWKSYITKCNNYIKSIYWAPTILLFLAVIGILCNVLQDVCFKLLFFILLGVVLPKMVFSIFSFIGRCLGAILPIAKRIGFLIGSSLAVVVFVISIYGFVSGWKKLTIKEVNIVSQKLPAAFDNYRIVQLSDLHLSTYDSSPETVTLLVEMVNALKPDLIVFTGDLINHAPNELDPYSNILSKLKAKDGVYSILGNHDYCMYHRFEEPNGAIKAIGELKLKQQAMGWKLLLNDNVQLHRDNDSILLVGVENDGNPPFPAYADLEKALVGAEKSQYKILLSHDPTHWRREIMPNTDIDLTLSGHTHSMQVRIGEFSPSMWAYDEWGGLYSEDERSLYVNTGTGSNVPFRYGAWPEITFITLNNKTK